MIIVDNLCKICHDHEVDNFSVGLRRSKIMVVTNRKSSGVFQKTLNAQLEEVGLDLGDIYFTPVIKCRDYEAHLTKSQLKEHAAELLIPEIEAIKRLVLDRLKIGYAFITGEVPMEARGEEVRRFQEDAECCVFIAQIQTAGLGITLHAADTATA